MFSTIKSRREAAELRANSATIIGAGYTFDIPQEAADAGVSFGVLRQEFKGGHYFVNEPYGYYDALELPRDPRK